MTVEDLPEGFAFAVKAEGKGEQQKYRVTIKGPPDAPLSSRPVRVVCYGELKGSGHALVRELPLQVSYGLVECRIRNLIPC